MNIVFKKELPFIFTLLIAMIGVLLINVAEIATEIPIVQYEINKETDYYKIKIKNISSFRINKIDLLVEANEEHLFSDFKNVCYFSPAMEDSSNIIYHEHPKEITYSLGPLLTKNKVEIKFRYTGKKNDLCYRFALPDNESNALFEEKGFFTALIDHKLAFLVFLTIFLVSVLFLYIVIIEVKNND